MRSFAIATLLAAACAVNAANLAVTVSPGGTLTYGNDNINASAGDTITFTFAGGNHTVTQSSFANPCTRTQGGFASGFKSAQDTFTITVNDSSTLWYYCGQTVPLIHCHLGMVGAVNAPSTGNKTFAAFQTAAKALASSSTSSGASTASSTSAGGSGGSATSAASGASGTSSSSPSSTASGAAMQIGGSTLGALTAMALLVGLTL